MNSKRLIEIARRAIKTYFLKQDFKINEFSEKKGIFVTLYKDENLRGCIGFIKAINLNKGIIDAARAAAFSDPRFNPVQEEEFKDIRIEVSLLSEPELLKGDYLKKIEIGKDGLIVEKNFNSGLLLPQVALDYNVNAKEFLEMTCEKAGLDKNAWKLEDVKVYKFQCEVYSEEKPNGEVERVM